MRCFIAVLCGSRFRGAVLWLAFLLLSVSKAHADIHEWTLSGGSVVQSSTLCPGESGVFAVPNANLYGRDLTQAYSINANLTNATVTGANFCSTPITSSQLCSTANYQAGNLQGIELGNNNLSGWKFSGQNLSNAYLQYATLTKVNLTGANLSNAYLNAADMRGDIGFSGTASGASTTNTILPNDAIQGLTLVSTNSALSTLFVRNYGGKIPTPIPVQQNMTLTPSASLVLDFDASPWGSTISFDSSIPVTLGGYLELDLATEVNAAGLLGDTFRVFDWTGVNTSGQFASITSDVPTDYSWDTSQLYTTGNVTLVPEPGTIGLLVACAVGLAGFRLRRKNANGLHSP
jgi:uncharacterized protein YjbI with pentapeptide repeats